MSLTIEPMMLSFVAITISSISLFIAYVKGVREQEQRITKLETKMDLIWHYVDDNMGKILHSPHTPEIDALLEKMPKITLPEAETLKCMLLPDWKREEDPVRKNIYGLYLARIDSLILDKKNEKK